MTACPSNLTTAGTDHIWKGEVYKDSDFSEQVIINQVADSSHFVWLTAPVGQRHTGKAGTGVRNILSGVLGSSTSHFNTSSYFTIIEWMETLYGNVTTGSYNTHMTISGVSGCIIRNNICHGTHPNQYQPASILAVNVSYATNYVLNNIIYDVIPRQTQSIAGILGTLSNQGYTVIGNNTIYNLSGNAAFGISQWGPGSVMNNIVLSTSGTCFNVNVSFPGSFTNNMSSDNTASGTSSLINKLASNNFVSIVSGSEDLRLKSGADAIKQGVNLGYSNGINIDINGFNRVAQAYVWDIGAHQYTQTLFSIWMLAEELEEEY